MESCKKIDPSPIETMALKKVKIKEVKRFCEWYVLESAGMISFRECVKSCYIAYIDRALYVLPVGRQDFSSVNPEFRIIEGRITEVLLYVKFHLPHYCQV